MIYFPIRTGFQWAFLLLSSRNLEKLAAISHRIAHQYVVFGQACDRSLGAPLAHLEGSAYLGPREPVLAQLSHADSVNLSAGPSELLALGARIAQAGLN